MRSEQEAFFHKQFCGAHSRFCRLYCRCRKHDFPPWKIKINLLEIKTHLRIPLTRFACQPRLSHGLFTTLFRGSQGEGWGTWRCGDVSDGVKRGRMVRPQAEWGGGGTQKPHGGFPSMNSVCSYICRPTPIIYPN